MPNPSSQTMICAGCSADLEPSWKLCPFCGRAISRPCRRAGTAEAWRLWERYQGFVRDGYMPFMRSIAAVRDQALEVRVKTWKPERHVEVLAHAMRRLTELAKDTRLPGEFRQALRKLGAHREHEAHIAQTLSPALAELQGAIQSLIDAGDIEAGVLQEVGSWVARRDRANTFAEIGAGLIGIDASLLRIAARALSAWIDRAATSTRERRWEAACLSLAAASDRLIDRAWDHLVRETRSFGLDLPEASGLRALVDEAEALWLELTAAQVKQDGSFEQTLTRVHALAGRCGDAHPVQQLLRHADLLAAVRSPLVVHPFKRIALIVEDSTVARGRQHFLRLLPGDGVLAFFTTTVFGQGKAGLVLTTSSVQWFDGQRGQRFAYAQLRDSTIGHEEENLIVGHERIELSILDAEASAEALRACVRLSMAAPGPAVCACGAPGCWLSFGNEHARCPGCGGAVQYG